MSADLTVLLISQAVLLALPFLAASMVAARRGVRGVLGLVTAGILASAAVGYASFWIYFLKPSAGEAFAITAEIASLLVCLAVLLPRHTEVLDALRPLVLPCLVMGLACGSVLYLAFLYGGLDSPLSVAATRFSPTLPGDNTIPYIFALALTSIHRPVPVPLVGDWLSSDRPPLQTGIVLSQWPFFIRSRTDLHYEILSMLLQSMWVLGVWAFMVESRLPRLLVALTVGAAALSGFVLINTFYVWPKLMPVAYLMLAAAVVLTPRFRQVRASAWWGAALGGLAAAAMLCHEGSVFGLAAIVIALLLLRRIPSMSFCVAAIGVLVLAMAPWLWYQHFYEPPADRLIRWQLAGDLSVHSKYGAVKDILHQYRSIGVRQAIDDKISNVRALFGHPRADLLDVVRAAIGPHRDAAAYAFRNRTFYEFFPGVGLMALGPIALAAGALLHRRHDEPSRELSAAAIGWLTVGVGMVVWCLLMFLPGSTVPHQGCYVFELLAYCAGMAAWWLISRRLAVLVAASQIAVNLSIYVILNPERPGWGPGLNPVTLLLAVLTVLLLVAVLAAYALTSEQRTSTSMPGSDRGTGRTALEDALSPDGVALPRVGLDPAPISDPETA